MDGTLLKVHADAVSALFAEHCPTNLHGWYRSSSEFWLSWTIKACENYAGTCVYYEVSCHVGNMKNRVLNEVETDFVLLRTDWTCQEVVGLRRAYAVAESFYKEAKSALQLFGER